MTGKEGEWVFPSLCVVRWNSWHVYSWHHSHKWILIAGPGLARGCYEATALAISGRQWAGHLHIIAIVHCILFSCIVFIVHRFTQLIQSEDSAVFSDVSESLEWYVRVQFKKGGEGYNPISSTQAARRRLWRTHMKRLKLRKLVSSATSLWLPWASSLLANERLTCLCGRWTDVTQIVRVWVTLQLNILQALWHLVLESPKQEHDDANTSPTRARDDAYNLSFLMETDHA